MCNNSERNEKKEKIAPIDFRGAKVYSKLKCSDKLVQIVDNILFQNWTIRLCYKSIKVSSMKWLKTHDLENNNHEESETYCPLPRFKRLHKIYFKAGDIHTFRIS